MSNFALGRLVRVAIVGPVGFVVVRAALSGSRMPPDQQVLVAGIAGFLLMIFAHRHT